MASLPLLCPLYTPEGYRRENPISYRSVHAERARSHYPLVLVLLVSVSPGAKLRVDKSHAYPGSDHKAAF